MGYSWRKWRLALVITSVLSSCVVRRGEAAGSIGPSNTVVDRLSSPPNDLVSMPVSSPPSDIRTNTVSPHATSIKTNRMAPELSEDNGGSGAAYEFNSDVILTDDFIPDTLETPVDIDVNTAESQASNPIDQDTVNRLRAPEGSCGSSPASSLMLEASNSEAVPPPLSIDQRFKVPAAEFTWRCALNDVACEHDRLGYDAIRQLHSQIDDDKSGDLDREESQEFIRDDLKHEALSRDTDIHGSDDLLSVEDLWKLWIHSEVYTWTTEQVVDWLTTFVELPQYSTIFRAQAIDGRLLPRLALSNAHSFANAIGIKNPVHKQKLAIKATDVVLFGPPKLKHNYKKDVLLVTSLIVAVCGGYYAYIQQRRSQEHLTKVMADLSSLQNAEDNLRDVQQKLEAARRDQARIDDDKRDLERKLRAEIDTAKAEAERLKQRRETTDEQMSSLKLAEDELNQVRSALHEAERQLEEGRHLSALPDLQQWLQLTYEVETKYFDAKREATERQLRLAKDMCEKIRNQKGKFLSAFRMAHTSSIDDTDQTILSVKAALEEIKLELQERTQRWKRIEQICNFNIAINPGAPYLNSILRDNSPSQSISSCFSSTDGGLQRNLANVIGGRFDVDSICGRDDDCQSLCLAQVGKQSSFCVAPSQTIPRVSSMSGRQLSSNVLPTLIRAGMQLSCVGVSRLPQATGINQAVCPRTVSSSPMEYRPPPRGCQTSSQLDRTVYGTIPPALGGTPRVSGWVGSRSGGLRSTCGGSAAPPDVSESESEDSARLVTWDVGDVGDGPSTSRSSPLAPPPSSDTLMANFTLPSSDDVMSKSQQMAKNGHAHSLANFSASSSSSLSSATTLGSDSTIRERNGQAAASGGMGGKGDASEDSSSDSVSLASCVTSSTGGGVSSEEISSSSHKQSSSKKPSPFSKLLGHKIKKKTSSS